MRSTAEMKGFIEDSDSSIGLLDEAAAFRDVIDHYIYEHTINDKHTFFVSDLGKIVKKHNQWQNVAAHIKPFYTVKCNSAPVVLEIMAALGTGFSCTSKNEMTMVLELGISPESIIYSNPCKQASQLKYAAKVGVNIMTCDSESELRKIARNHPCAKLLLHIATEDLTEEEVNMTIGTTLKGCRHLLECAKELSVDIIGVKFHVSSTCKAPQAYIHALSDARCVFDMAEELGFKMNILDIGSGFTGSQFQLEEINHAINTLLEIYFPEECGIQLIAEPGSYYVSAAFTLVVKIIAKKIVEYERQLSSEGELARNDEPAFLYYMSDGVYGSFTNKLSDNLNAVPAVHKKCRGDEPLFVSSLWGPSCDELDRIVEYCLLPELNVGDWILFENMGAGSLNEQSPFSDSDQPPLYNIISFSDWYEMQDAGITSEALMKNFMFVPSCFQQSEEKQFPAVA
ncbi:antizyme inhibitor 1 [Pleurodeles waltl]|uniref:antizyme inhibitor 1 n=1 Tax=Pleurodeles waltl TaxID=8319 RepID=UPI003709A2EF